MKEKINKAIEKAIVKFLPILLIENKLLYTINTWLENNKSRVLHKEEELGYLIHSWSGLPDFIFVDLSKNNKTIYENDRLFLLTLVEKIESKALYGSYEVYEHSEECFAKLLLANIISRLLSE